MRHPNETDLALYAGNDLGRLARLRVDWHLRSCGKCQQEVTEFSSLRADTMRSAPEPEVNWDRLAAEMKANIHLGLEAGECIRPAHSRTRVSASWSWVAVATAALVAITAGGEIWLHHPGFLEPVSAPANIASLSPQEVVFEVKGSAIQMRNNGDVTSELRNNSGGAVVYSVNAQGSVGASYVDPDSGTATVNNIYYGQ